MTIDERTSIHLADLFSAPAALWSLGLSAAQVLFKGGALDARLDGANAAYDQTVARYRQVVLTAFQNVEDNLVSLRILKEVYQVQHTATISARKALDVTMNQYKAGTINYLNYSFAENSV